MEAEKITIAPLSRAEKQFQRLLWLVCVTAALVCAALLYQHINFKKAVYESAQADLKQLTHKATQEIDAILRQAMQSADDLAAGLSSGEVTRQNMQARLKAMLNANADYFGASITFAPFAYDRKLRLYSAYYSRSGADGALEFMQLADIYDYTKPDYDWYVVPMAEGNRWGEPYWDEAGKTYMTTYSARFYLDDGSGGKSPAGVVTIDISMNQIKRIIESIDIGASGFGALTTRDGNYLYHPNYEYVQARKNIRDVAREKNDNNRLLMADMASRGEGGIIDHVSTTTGEASWLIFETVPISGWSLQNTFIKDDLAVDVDALRQQIIWIMIAAIVFLFSLAALLLRIVHGTPARVWLFTAVVSALLVVGIGVLWNLALTYHSSSKVAGVKLSDKATLQALMQGYLQENERKRQPPPLFIPTGLYIDTIEFNGANDVLVTGRVWQKYAADYPDTLAKGVRFGRAKSVKLDKIDVVKSADGELISWSFQADLRVELDYSRYPLEVEHLSMQLLPLESDRNLTLVPDLDGYKLTSATLLPGLDKSVFIPGWKLTEAYFLYHRTDFSSNFGIEQDFDQETLPTLYYEIGVKRIFIDAFISNLTPLIVVAIILFALVLLSKSVDIGKILSVCVAVFFVVVFSHLDIRKNIAAGEIFYLEYFYFVVYFAIILVPMDAIRIALGMRSRFFDFKHGLLAQMIYWPSILGIFFVITAIKFY